MYRTIITSTIIVYRAYIQRVFYYVRTTTYDHDGDDYDEYMYNTIAVRDYCNILYLCKTSKYMDFHN